MPLDHATGKHRGFGFVQYEEASDAADAVENMNDGGARSPWWLGKGKASGKQRRECQGPLRCREAAFVEAFSLMLFVVLFCFVFSSSQPFPRSCFVPFRSRAVRSHPCRQPVVAGKDQGRRQGMGKPGRLGGFRRLVEAGRARAGHGRGSQARVRRCQMAFARAALVTLSALRALLDFIALCNIQTLSLPRGVHRRHGASPLPFASAASSWLDTPTTIRQLAWCERPERGAMTSGTDRFRMPCFPRPEKTPSRERGGGCRHRMTVRRGGRESERASKSRARLQRKRRTAVKTASKVAGFPKARAKILKVHSFCAAGASAS